MNLSPMNLLAIAARLGSKTIADVSDEDIAFTFSKLEIETTDELTASVKKMITDSDPSAIATVWLQKHYADGSLANLVTDMSGGFVWVRCPHCDLPFDVSSQLNSKE